MSVGAPCRRNSKEAVCWVLGSQGEGSLLVRTLAFALNEMGGTGDLKKQGRDINLDLRKIDLKTDQN